MIKWSICILTVPERENDLARLFGSLKRQVGDRDIQILVNDRGGALGEKRQWCLNHAMGEYICFIDDDDLVAHDYVETIYPLLDGVDYIGFRLQLYNDGAKQKPTFHSLRYENWSEDENGFYRNVSHLNPIRTEISREGRFDGGFGEDFRWSQQVKPVTEHFIDKPLYFYFHSSKYSLSQGVR